MECLESCWPLDAQPGTHRVTELSIRVEGEAPGLKVAVEDDRLVISDRRPDDVAFPPSSTRFISWPVRIGSPGSRGPHLHLEAFAGDDTSAYVEDSLPLIITRSGRPTTGEPSGFIPS